MKVKISVIVPVYNVEKYIVKCIESIVMQTYRDFELILIDDGSPDNCPSICDDYAEKYDFVRVIHKKNGGLSNARNTGVSIARGNYVTFIDSDDYVSEHYLEIFNDMLAQYQADICVVGIQSFYENEDVYSNIKSEKRMKLTSIQALESMLYQKYLDTSACALLLPINIVKDNPFPVGKFHEDELTTYKYYAAVNSVAISNAKLYYYFQRRNSIMHTFGQASLDELDAADNLVDVCAANWPDLLPAAHSKKFSDYCQVLLSIDDLKKANPDIYDRIVLYLGSTKNMMLFNKNSRRKNRVAALALLFGPECLIRINTIKKRIKKVGS